MNPVNKEKHFIVTRLVLPDIPEQPIQTVEIEAVYSGRSQLISWHQLNDEKLWEQGWK